MNTMLAAALWVTLGGSAMPSVTEYSTAMDAFGIAEVKADCEKGCKGDFPAASDRRFATQGGSAGTRDGPTSARSTLADEVDRSDLACLVSGKCPPTFLVGTAACRFGRCSEAILA